MAYGTVNTDIVADSSGGRLAPISSVFRNRIINGDMRIDQRNAGASVATTNVNIATYTVDRWAYQCSPASKFTIQQNAGSVTPPVGFTNYLGITSTSAYSLGSGDYFRIAQPVEGFNISDLGWGTANAKTVTLSVWVYSSLTGTFGGCLQNSASNRSYPFTYSIPVANTWTTVSVTIAGDTTGAWLTTNSMGMLVQFGLGVGATLSGTAGSWVSANYVSATGATSVVGTSGATFYITGVQLEVGSSATGFEYVNYQTSLANCQRYYSRNTGGVFQISAYATNFGTQNIQFKVSMRTTPTMVATPNAGSVTCTAYDRESAVISITSAASGSNLNCSWTATAEL